MSYCINYYNPQPATQPRTKTIYYDTLSACFAEIETYVYLQQLGLEKKTDAHIVTADSRIIKMRWDKVIITIESIPFDFNTQEKFDLEQMEQVGDCRKYKNPSPRLPQFTAQMYDKDVRMCIYGANVGIEYHDPSEVFTQEFLDGIGYNKNKGGA